MASTRRELLTWGSMAVAACTLLIGVLVWQNHATVSRYANFLSGDPHQGARVFERKQCSYCHSIGGTGGHIAPPLGFQLRPRTDMRELVTAMWNHAPNMWETMRLKKIDYPSLTPEETADLFAFLYTARYVDEPGNTAEGRALFQSKGCVRCHAVRGEGGTRGPELSAISGVDTPIVWAQTMWNHAPAMQAGMNSVGLSWPRFQGEEMNDLLAYIRENSGGARHEQDLLPADPDNGWRVFQQKSCITCHPLKDEKGTVGPYLGANKHTPTTLVQFAGRMWNHSPEMWKAMQARGVARPMFQGREMADLIAFLYGLRYFEPGGSPQMGGSVFMKRGCAECHGADAAGTSRGPSLRRRGTNMTTTSLAQVLWQHGPMMYERARKAGIPWPTLNENDIGDLVAFLNTPRERPR